MKKSIFYIIFLIILTQFLFSCEEATIQGNVIDVSYREELILKIKNSDYSISYYKVLLNNEDLQVDELEKDYKDFKSNYSEILKNNKKNAFAIKEFSDFVLEHKNQFREQILKQSNIDDIFINVTIMCFYSDNQTKMIFYEFDDGDFVYDNEIYLVQLNNENQIINHKPIKENNHDYGIEYVIPEENNNFLFILYDYKKDETVIEKYNIK